VSYIKKKLLPAEIVYECVEMLLRAVEFSGSHSVESIEQKEECLQFLCKLLTTAGSKMEAKRSGKQKVDTYFDRLRKLTKSDQPLPSRQKFMILDLIEIRQRGWESRLLVEGPKKITNNSTESDAAAILIPNRKKLNEEKLREHQKLEKLEKIQKNNHNNSNNDHYKKQDKDLIQTTPSKFIRNSSNDKLFDEKERERKLSPIVTSRTRLSQDVRRPSTSSLSSLSPIPSPRSISSTSSSPSPSAVPSPSNLKKQKNGNFIYRAKPKKNQL